MHRFEAWSDENVNSDLQILVDLYIPINHIAGFKVDSHDWSTSMDLLSGLNINIMAIVGRCEGENQDAFLLCQSSRKF